MRFDYILEAPTAAAQKADEPTLTYLNKGQLYGISMMDKMHSDTFYSTTLRISFHEDSHRKGAATYWNFWLNQQENPRVARAIELDKAGSIGVVSAETKQFDRVTFQWQGRRGAKIMVRFNCLSTDFSRIKGVKGIPLRIHLDTHYATPAPMGATTFSPTSANSSLASGKIIERCYARIKLFRDKGAERKNKDDQRHLDKLWEKQKPSYRSPAATAAAPPR
ncbi:CP2 transcription factor [Kickxella alabastrina]|uniref:CP2 transcription factor n=1 Tax=Kickxella alabastrina TaxID=61397 RepID=UPI0022204F34|nr:CP2 transcription factor [Kickxella alabastrina]KAI7831858.1 CP2 transcription factor [Kickxella alabastrina]